jgi:hypothetical protein
MLTVAKKNTEVAVRRNKIDALAQSLVAHTDPEEVKKEIDDSTTHHFCEGVYAREYHLPAGHVVIGRVHKRACFNVMLKGRMTITSSRTEAHEVSAPQFFVSEAGEQKALYAHEDVVFVTFHATEETDPEAMVDIFTVPDIKAFAQYERERLTHQEKDK